MKKIVSKILALALTASLLLTACGTSSNDEGTTSGDNSTEQTTESTGDESESTESTGNEIWLSRNWLPVKSRPSISSTARASTIWRT